MGKKTVKVKHKTNHLSLIWRGLSCILSIYFYFYHLETKFWARQYFHKCVSFLLSTGEGGWLSRMHYRSHDQEGLPPEGVCFHGVLHPGESASGGCAFRGCASRGVGIQGGSASRGVCIRGLCRPPITYYGIHVWFPEMIRNPAICSLAWFFRMNFCSRFIWKGLMSVHWLYGSLPILPQSALETEKGKGSLFIPSFYLDVYQLYCEMVVSLYYISQVKDSGKT